MTEDGAAIESPCVRECVIEEGSGHCRGCCRTLDEISFWTRFTDAERRDVLARLPARRALARSHNPD